MMHSAHSGWAGRVRLWAGISLAALLAGCGGGGGGTPSAPVNDLTSGLYSGTSATGEELNVMTLADGTFWATSDASALASGTSSVILGKVTASGGTFASTSAKTWALPGTPLPVLDDTKVAGTYAGTRLSATITLGPASSSYTLTYQAGSRAQAALAQIAGAYADTLKIFASTFATGFEQPTVALRIDPGTGAVSGTLACAGSQVGTVAGTVTPRTDLNAFNVSLRFTTADPAMDAALGGSTFTGYALYDATGKELQVVARPLSGNPIGCFASGPN